MAEAADERFLRQIKKGVMEMLVLEHLSRKPDYGYALLMGLAKAPGGCLKVKEGTLYPILYRLEEDGYLKSGWQQGEGRAAPKKIYTITEEGRRQLESQRRTWQTFRQDVEFIQKQEG